MDRMSSEFEVEMPAIMSVPLRCPAKMPPQPIIPWTLSRMVLTLGRWLIAETPLSLPPKQT